MNDPILPPKYRLSPLYRTLLLNRLRDGSLQLVQDLDGFTDLVPGPPFVVHTETLEDVT